MRYRFVILGAGVAGLVFAQMLKRKGITDFIVIEKENEAGGLCRSVQVDGAPLDIGGGHFLDVRRPKVNELVFDFLPEKEWNLFDRDSRIDVKGCMIGHPFEANIWQLPIEEQVKYLKSIAVAGCNLGAPMPVDFVNWISWKLGECISENYMLPYNRKMFGENLNALGTYWLNKLPDVSFEETLLSCLEKKAYGTQPGHAKFYYPKKYGYGEVWLRMARDMEKNIIYNSAVVEMDFESKSVKLENGDVYSGEYIITTIPWNVIKTYKGIEKELEGQIKKLKHTGVCISYVSEQMNTEAQWIYYPDEELDYHRVLVRTNFFEGARGYWKETNLNRYREKDEIAFDNPYAYPLNTIEKPQVMENLLKYCETKGVIGLGRWGEHEHLNSDVTAERAMKLAERLIG